MVPYFGVLITKRILLFRVRYWGPLLSETPDMESERKPFREFGFLSTDRPRLHFGVYGFRLSNTANTFRKSSATTCETPTARTATTTTTCNSTSTSTTTTTTTTANTTTTTTTTMTTITAATTTATDPNIAPIRAGLHRVTTSAPTAGGRPGHRQQKPFPYLAKEGLRLSGLQV